MSRRQILGAAVAVTAVSAVGLTGSDAQAADPWEQLTADHLRANIGRSYTFDTGARSFTLRLTEVDGLGGQPVRQLAFSALFSGPAAQNPGGEVGMLFGPNQARVEVLMTGSPNGQWELIRNSEVPV